MNAGTTEISLRQSAEAPGMAGVDRLPAWICVTAHPEDGRWSEIPYGIALQRRRQRLTAAARHDPMSFDLPNARGTRVVHAGIAETCGAFERLSTARRMVDLLTDLQPTEVGVSVHGYDPAAAERMAEAVLSALLARAVSLPSFKQGAALPSRLRRIRLLGLARAHGFARSFAEARGNGLARQLAALPSNVLTPADYRRRIALLAREQGWTFEYFDTAALKRKGAGAFLAVAQGSGDRAAGIAHLRAGPRRARRRVALVGKGICFDTGGVNVKPNRYMLGMHQDMAGSAIALGSLLALSSLDTDLAVECWLALAVNQIGPMAYKPNDVVKALDGTSIEIVHTDAEGRMVLADTLVLASRARPSLIIDYATLTGACVHALGKSYSGAFTNREDWLVPLIDAGRASGERIWPFPFDADFDKALESGVADIRQCAPQGEADHILAARFLHRFVKHDVPWIHLDLASATRKDGLAHVPTDETGFGVRLTCQLLLDQKIV